MKLKNVLLIGAGVIGGLFVVNKITNNDDSETLSTSGQSGYPGIEYSPTFDFSGLFDNETLATPTEAFSTSETSIPTKKEASSSSLSSGYTSISTGKSVNIFEKVSLDNADRFAVKEISGGGLGLVDRSTQQSITPEEYAKRVNSFQFGTKKLEATA